MLRKDRIDLLLLDSLVLAFGVNTKFWNAMVLRTLQTTWASIMFFSEASMMLCRSVPEPDASTPTRSFFTLVLIGSRYQFSFKNFFDDVERGVGLKPGGHAMGSRDEVSLVCKYLKEMLHGRRRYLEKR